MAKLAVGDHNHVPLSNTYNPLPKRARRSIKVDVEEQRREYGSSRPVSMTLADPDLLDCPICFEILCCPVYQCENGHIACAWCCTSTLKNMCSNCCLPIGHIRCRAIEKILESVRVKCRYTPYGCKEVFSYGKKVGHEKSCNYVPCSCPFIGCNFVGTSKILYDHSALQHKDSCKQFYFNSKIFLSMDTSEEHVILREGNEGVLFILSRCIGTLGTFYNVVCVAQSATEKRFLYELTASTGNDAIIVKTSVEMVSKWTKQPLAKMSLMVSNNFISTSPLIRLDLIIRKKPVHAT